MGDRRDHDWVAGTRPPNNLGQNLDPGGNLYPVGYLGFQMGDMGPAGYPGFRLEVLGVCSGAIATTPVT